MSKPHEVFETEDLLQKNQKIEIVGARQQHRCCQKIPFRIWIGLMVFLTTYINYTTRVNLSIAIVSMVETPGSKPDPYCKRSTTTIATTPLTTTLSTNGTTLLENGTTIFTNDTTLLTSGTTLIGNETVGTSKVTTVATKSTTSLPDYGKRYPWSEQVQGQIVGSYFYGYVVSSLFGGAASELIGPFNVIFYSHIVIAIFNSLCVWAPQLHFSLLIVCRVVIGTMAGFVYPALQVLIAKWAPPSEKGKFVSMLMGNTLGTCVTWPLVGYVTMQSNYGWGFHVISVQNLIFCLIFFFVASDSPEKSRYVKEKELNYIKEAQGGTVSKQKLIAPYLKIFTSFPFWMLAVLHFGNLWGLYVQLTTVPKYMAQVVGFNLRDSGALSALPHICRMFAGTGFGVLEDFLKSRKLTTAKFNRKFFTLFSHVLPGICLMLIAVVKCDAVGNIVLLIFSMTLNGAATITNLRNPQDLAPNFAGTLFGIISFIGGLTGFIVPAILAALIAQNSTTTEWGIHFLIGGTVYCACGIIFIIFGSVELQPWNEPKKKEGQE